ncbi:MAG TPA: inositol monophosphatase family protein [Hyphomicrobiaceae bacterium]|nr:inositol monophosphatase family protein [Hyphomicrobiaceae bacterium]
MPLIDIDRVSAIVREVGQRVVLPRWRNLGERDVVEKSGPGDLVTVADKAAEEALTPALSALVAGSVVVGEEAVHADPTRRGLFDGDGPVWVIDPIDGTSAFASGKPEFFVMVALVSGRELAAGWIYGPASDTLYAAERGAGAFRVHGDGPHERIVRVVPPAELSAFRGAIGRRYLSAEEQAAMAARLPRVGPCETALYAGREYPRLVSGELDFLLYRRTEPWDHLPGLAIASEQGFAYCRHDGSAYLPGMNSGGLVIAPELWLERVRANFFA